MATEKQIVAVFEKVEAEVGGFIAASMVDLDSGMTLAVHSRRDDFDLAAASAFNSEMVKLKNKTIETLGLKGSLEDVLLSLTDQIHLIKMVGKTAFIYLAVERSQSNLAIVRTSVNKHVGDLD